MVRIYILTAKVRNRILSQRKNNEQQDSDVFRCRRCRNEIELDSRCVSQGNVSEYGTHKTKHYHYWCADRINLI